MHFNDTATPDQLKILTAALERHCHQYGIECGDEHDDLARLVMAFYRSGARSSDELSEALAATRPRTGRSLQ